MFALIAAGIMDRQLMAILAEPIRNDLGLSSTQIGLLAGTVFAVFYALVSLPVALLVDRFDRVRILGWTGIVSGLATAAGGLAGSFAALAGARAVVAIGDAGGPPAIWSLVCAWFTEARRPRIIAAIQIGAPVGGVAAFVVGGLVAQHLDWRAAFWISGAVGVLLGALALWLLPEPRRLDTAPRPAPPVRQALAFLLGQPAFLWGSAGIACAGLAMFGLAQWAPSVMQREHGWTSGQTGIAVGLVTALGGIAGTWVSGLLAQRRRMQGDEGAEFAVAAGAVALAVPALAASLVVDGPWAVLAAYGAAITGLLAWNAPTIAGFQLVADDGTRALAAALHVFWVNMLGLGLGPLAIGMMDDALATVLPGRSLGLSVAVVAGAAALAAMVCLLCAAGALRKARATRAQAVPDSAS
jgi:predicted MFS family arabinose efflux permease